MSFDYYRQPPHDRMHLVDLNEFMAYVYHRLVAMDGEYAEVKVSSMWHMLRDYERVAWRKGVKKTRTWYREVLEDGSLGWRGGRRQNTVIWVRNPRI